MVFLSLRAASSLYKCICLTPWNEDTRYGIRVQLKPKTMAWRVAVLYSRATCIPVHEKQRFDISKHVIVLTSLVFENFGTSRLASRLTSSHFCSTARSHDDILPLFVCRFPPIRPALWRLSRCRDTISATWQNSRHCSPFESKDATQQTGAATTRLSTIEQLLERHVGERL